MAGRGAAFLAVLVLAGCARGSGGVTSAPPDPPTGKTEVATFAAGCFWCTEAVFGELNGVISAIPGYSGGTTPHPTYEQVSAGGTGHAETIQVTYDPARISYTDLLEVFWKTHDPTTLNRQGEDVGTQYRSVIFWHDQNQRNEAERTRKALDQSGIYKSPIVTQIVPFKVFWPAEDYHRDYFRRNPDKAYCQLVIQPKVEKFRRIFRDKLRQ